MAIYWENSLVPSRNNKHHFGSRWIFSSCDVSYTELGERGNWLIIITGLSMDSIQDRPFMQVSHPQNNLELDLLSLLNTRLDWGDTLQITVKNSLQDNG